MAFDSKSMGSQESKKRLRCSGIEFRIVFCLAAFVLVLAAGAIFKSSLGMSILFVFSAFVIRLDYSYNLICLTTSGLVFQKILWRKLASWKVYITWNEVEKVTTSTCGFFKLLKSTKVEGKIKEFFTVFSFIKDYLHFLKDISRKAESAQINKLTLDLIAGRSEV
jgi:hypothetical protein